MLLAPFAWSEDCPLVLLQGECEVVPIGGGCMMHDAKCMIAAQRRGGQTWREEERERYAHDFAFMHAALRRGDVEKVVLARTSERDGRGFLLAPDGPGSPGSYAHVPSALALFQEACRRYPHSFVMMCNTEATGLWLTATPERLLWADAQYALGQSASEGVQGEQSGQPARYQCSTMALAGTRAWGKDADFSLQGWDEKNRREQALVADYIEARLSPLCTRLRREPARTVRAASLLHLCSPLQFEPSPGVSLADVVELLHPTPAVCGVPTHEARRLILEGESSPRRYYAGYQGIWNPRGSTRLFVSLRCMSLSPEGRATLYAGGGLLRESELESEWQETCRKMSVMHDLIHDA